MRHKNKANRWGGEKKKNRQLLSDLSLQMHFWHEFDPHCAAHFASRTAVTMGLAFMAIGGPNQRKSAEAEASVRVLVRRVGWARSGTPSNHDSLLESFHQHQTASCQATSCSKLRGREGGARNDCFLFFLFCFFRQLSADVPKVLSSHKSKRKRRHTSVRRRAARNPARLVKHAPPPLPPSAPALWTTP